jgi:hypothetical protein
MVRRGSAVRVRQRALQRPRKTGSFVFATTCPSPARSGVEAFWKNGSFGFRPSEASWERAVKSTNARAGQFNARMTWSQSSMCSLSISRTLGIRSALRFSWGYPPCFHAR